MAQLMGKNLQHQDLIWVVPCVVSSQQHLSVRSSH
jgi:hypothetical protein